MATSIPIRPNAWGDSTDINSECIGCEISEETDVSGKVTLLVNTGTPASPDQQVVREYLSEFLNDPYIMGMPERVRTALVNRIIVSARVKGSAARYQRLFDDHGGRSPLAFYGDDLASALTEKVEHPVLQLMRYGEPKLDDIADQLADADNIVIAPMFPHETYSSYTSAVEFAVEGLRHRFPKAQLSLLRPYYDHPGYIQALATNLGRYSCDDYDLVVISFHSIPVSHQMRGAREGMDYQQQCRTTAHLLAQAAHVPDEKLRITFQSAIKPMKWLEPALEIESVAWAKSGARRLLVVCPGFVIDCLETVYDIGSKLSDRFIEAGGTEFALVPALNAEEHWIRGLASILNSDLVEPITA